jgi:glycosyltransferase involved in cell wall biosynthesis
MSGFAYLFERFPSFTQTFCYREVLEMRRQGANPPIYSIRRPPDIPSDCPADLASDVIYLPAPDELGRQMKTVRMLGRYPWPIVRDIRCWGKRPGKARLLEAAWLGAKLRERGIRHVHSHFAGIAARTAFHIKKFYGITFSFTGHANDMFCESNSPISLRDLVREAAFVVAVSEFSRDWICRRMPEFEAKIHRIYNGMDIAGWPPAAARAQVPQIVSVGRCIEKKGYSDLIDACAILRKKGYEFECAILGGGPLEDPLRARVAELGIGDRVRLEGPCPQGEVRRRLAGATIFVLACATEPDGGMDTLPTVIVEAMAAGLPVVSTRLAAVPEMVQHGVTGLLVDEKQPERLAAAIAELLRNPALAERYGQAGKLAASERFSSGPTVASLRALLARTAPDSPV